MGAEDILRQQRAEAQARKKLEETDNMAQVQVAEQTARIKLDALNAGFDPADPVGAWHRAVAAFNEEKNQFDTLKSQYAIQHNSEVQLLITDRKKLNDDLVASQAKIKDIENKVAAKNLELATSQKASQVVANETAQKKAELEDCKTRLKLIITEYRKILDQVEDRDGYHYNIAMSDKLGRFRSWAKNLFGMR